MEYNVDLLDGLDIYQENSLTLILKQIVPGSSILEFGPAYGRMTRFMNENLGCRVCCVEINSKAKETLEKYAEKVVIGNIEDYDWVDEFKQGEFDYIIFADVLEHLINPDEVLKRVIPFLKAKGQIFISVPNIAHNAIIRSLYLNKFQYQDYGILDRTHVRFFAIDTLEKMVNECGLSVCNRFATYYNDEMTGILQGDETINNDLLATLSQRPYANVYQFVYTLGKEPIDENENFDKIEKWQRTYKFKVYVDRGTGFTEEDTYEENVRTESSNKIEILVKSRECIKNIRIDPLDASCICRVNEISIIDTENNTYEIVTNSMETNALYYNENLFVFDDNDPQFVIHNINREIKSIKVSFEILFTDIMTSQLSDLLCNGLRILVTEKNKSNQRNEDLRKESEERAQKVAELTYKINCMQAESESLRKESEERALKIEELKYKIDCMQTELDWREKQTFEKNLELIKFQDLNL